MKFGLHYLMTCSDAQSPAQRYRDTIEQAARSEALGFESVWPVEQHFFRSASALPNPMILLAAIAERTRKLRLGTAIVQLPLDHPLRIAEQIATLDVLSGGRVEFGVGRGGNPTHFAGFGVPMAESRDRMVEALDYIRQAFTEETFSFRGRFFQADNICLVPKPIQKPHPPIRIAANSADTAELAGRSGYPVIFATNTNPFPKLRELFPRYCNARKEGGHSEVRPEDVSILMPIYVAETQAQVREETEQSINHYGITAASLAAPWLEKCTVEAERQKLQTAMDQLRRISYDHVNSLVGILDTPEACVERLKQFQQEFTLGRLICWFNFGGQVPHDKVLRSMELFSSKVLPHF